MGSHIADAVKALEDTIGAMKKQRLEDRKHIALLTTNVSDIIGRMREQSSNRKWIEDNARRLDAPERHRWIKENITRLDTLEGQIHVQMYEVK